MRALAALFPLDLLAIPLFIYIRYMPIPARGVLALLLRTGLVFRRVCVLRSQSSLARQNLRYYARQIIFRCMLEDVQSYFDGR